VVWLVVVGFVGGEWHAGLMCGRYVVTTPPSQLALEFDAVLSVEDELPPDYNVAPTKQVPAVLVRSGTRMLSTLKWGLVPYWAKDPSIGARMINARIETAAEKPVFRQAFAKRRCLLPADGYYEWLAPQAPAVPAAEAGGKTKKPPKPRKQPFFIHPEAAGETVAFAGLYERWRDAEGGELWSASILTTASVGELAAIHDRMPLSVPASGWEAWLDPALGDPETARGLLDFAPRWIAVPVSDAVNSVRNNGPELLEPVTIQAPAEQAAQRTTQPTTQGARPEPGEPEALF
jgi:putative SOS response-associated peptidase YedK